MRPIHAFLVLVVVAAVFGFASGFSVSQVGKLFGSGFSQSLYSPGLVIVAAALVGGLAESAGASAWVWLRLHANWAAALVGLIAGAGASPACAFAVVTPLLPPVGEGYAAKRQTPALALALAISASHGLFAFSPGMIAAVAILGASWTETLLIGAPLALIVAAFGAVWSRWQAADAAPLVAPPVAERPRSVATVTLIVATAVALALLIMQSIGDMPSEPLGGGGSRELVIGVGRPLILFLALLGIMFVGTFPVSAKRLADSACVGRILGDVAGLVLIVGAAGGLQRLCQETGMAELTGERLFAVPAGAAFAVTIPFFAAAAIKALQGSSLVAAIAAAGMAQQLLAPLGLADAHGKALAALAVGAGAMAVSHINDDYFWLVANGAGLSPARALGKFTLGALLQGLIALAALLLLSALMHP